MIILIPILIKNDSDINDNDDDKDYGFKNKSKTVTYHSTIGPELDKMLVRFPRISPVGDKIYDNTVQHEQDEESDETPDDEMGLSKPEPWFPSTLSFLEVMLSTQGYRLGCINNCTKVDFSSTQQKKFSQSASEFIKLVNSVIFGSPRVFAAAHFLPVTSNNCLERDEAIAIIDNLKIMVFWARYNRFYGHTANSQCSFYSI